MQDCNEKVFNFILHGFYVMRLDRRSDYMITCIGHCQFAFQIGRRAQFIEHFQDVARGHFTVRRLERIYGKETIRSEYDMIAADL